MAFDCDVIEVSAKLAAARGVSAEVNVSACDSAVQGAGRSSLEKAQRERGGKERLTREAAAGEAASGCAIN